MPSLFDSPEYWRKDPSNAFAAFVLAPEFLALSKRKPTAALDANGAPVPAAPIRGSSAKIYILMFGKFLRWLAMQNKTLFEVSSADLMAFLQQGRGDSQKVLKSAIRAQYLALLDRVYTHLKVPNPAQDACFSIFKSGNRALLGKNAQKVVLTDAQQLAFMCAL